MRLIDADAFFNDFPELRDYEYASQEYEVDAVPVIRCKECNWFERNNTKKGEVLYCYYHEINIKEDDFCSWGERREDGQID